MPSENLSEKLTPAARQTLDEIIGEYRDEILTSAAYEAARATGEVREISVHDIVGGTQRALRSHRTLSRAYIDRLLPLYAMLGTLSAMAGLGAYSVRQYATATDLHEQLPLVLALVGVMTTAISITLIYLRKIGSLNLASSKLALGENLDELYGKYLSTWRNIEVAVRNLASSRLGETIAQEPISFLVRRLQKQEILSSDEALSLQKLLATRNSVAHGERSPTANDLIKSLRQAQLLLDRIQHAA